MDGCLGERAREKLKQVLEGNVGLQTLKAINDVLRVGSTSSAIPDISPDAIAALKFAPITSVEVERSFSIYKNLLSDKRRRLTLKSIEMMLVIQCSSFDESD